MELITPQDLIDLSGFRCEVLSQAARPNLLMYLAMHQDYSSKFVADEPATLSEEEYGDLLVKRICKPSHFGVLEHPTIVFNFGFFPHSVMQQARTHRTGISFDVQSFRYTGEEISNQVRQYCAKGVVPSEIVERFIYIRPVGNYVDRCGKKYYYSPEMRGYDLSAASLGLIRYTEAFDRGISEEHARGMLPFDYRQHFVVSMNLRTALHFLEMRYKKDAQLEIQAMSHQIEKSLSQWCPQVLNWFRQNRLGKNKLAL